MKSKLSIFILLSVLMACMVAFGAEVNVDQLKQSMSRSADNLTTYNLSRSAEAELLYTNNSIQKEFKAVKSTYGNVDLVNQSGRWNSKLIDKSGKIVLTRDGYFINGSEYWKIGQTWTKLNISDSAQMMQDYNELLGQVNLIELSNMKLSGSERIQGNDYYKLVGTPTKSTYQGLMGLQLLAAYFPSPFPLPVKLRKQSLDTNSTDLMNNSKIVLTAWISKDKSLLKRLDINSSLTITPMILNLSSPNYMIKSTLNESTVYDNFGSPMKIALPKDAQNGSIGLKGTDWRWAVFGSSRP